MNYNKAELCKDCKMPEKPVKKGRWMDAAHKDPRTRYRHSLASDIRAMTHRNDHTEARRVLAINSGGTQDRIVELYTFIKKIQELEGHLPRGLELYRSELDRRLKSRVMRFDDGEIVWREL